MKVELIIPIEGLHGKLRRDGYYSITVTTRSEAWQKGDTSVVIQTKTVETYDAQH